MERRVFLKQLAATAVSVPFSQSAFAASPSETNASTPNYRKINSLEFRPVYTSLGLDRSAFKQAGEQSAKILDAAANIDGNKLWLFKNRKCHLYNLFTGAFELENIEFIGQTWPPQFTRGVSGVIYPGIMTDNPWIFFRDNEWMHVAENRQGSWPVGAGPINYTGFFSGAKGTWLENGFDAVLLDTVTEPNNRRLYHFFGGGGQYTRIGGGYRGYGGFWEGEGELLVAPKPIGEQFNLPAPFSSKIDLAFFDQGHTVFFSGEMAADFDLKHNKVLGVRPIRERFPAFERFLSRPQIFLVENYALETYVGEPTLGRLVDTRTVLPGSSESVVVVTERSSSAQTTLQQTVLEGQNDDVTKDYNDRLDNETQRNEGSEKYRYQMNADFHGDASATSAWGGEVNAQLGVRGGTDSSRESFAEKAFNSVSSQVKTVSQSFKQKIYSQGQTIENKDNVLNQQGFTITGHANLTRTFSFHQRLEPYYALLVLKDVRIAYGDGSGNGLVPKDLTTLPQLLEKLLVDGESRTKLMAYLKAELSEIADQRGQATTVFAETGGALPFSLKPNPSTTFEILLPNGQTQSIVVRGLVIKAVKDWQYPTTQVFPVVTAQ
jgi:hypothetical protein